MRKLIALVLVLAGLWSGYWLVGSTAKHQVIADWLEERRQDGWTVGYSDFRVVGYPNRFDSKFTDLDLRDPRSGIGWKTPEFDILALSYQPNHVIAVFSEQQSLSLPLEDVSVASSKMVASVVFEPDTKLAVARTSLETEGLILNGSSGWHMGIGHLHLSTRQHPSVDFAHDVVFDAKSVSPTVKLLGMLDPSGSLPSTISTLYLDMTLNFDAPWDRVAIERGAPLITKIFVNRLDTAWGELGLASSGVLDVAPNGQITGSVELELRNWRAVVELFVSAGAIDPSAAQTIQSGLAFFASGDSLKTNLRFADGAMYLGPVSIGPSPYFVRQ